jgi:hypothetical protein
MIKNEFLAGSWVGTGLTFLTMNTESFFILSFILTILLNLVALWDRFGKGFLAIGKRLLSALSSFLARWR